MSPDGSVRQILPDGITAAALHNQFIGNFQGLTELPRFLDSQERDLREAIKQQEEDEKSKHS